jgi:hypothetical protein
MSNRLNIKNVRFDVPVFIDGNKMQKNLDELLNA